MKKLILAGLAAAAVTLGAGVMPSAQAAVQCFSGPLGLLHSCSYNGPYYGPYYAPPPPPYYRPYWHD